MKKAIKEIKKRYRVNGKDLHLGAKLYPGYISGSFLAKEGDVRLGYLRLDWRYESDGKRAVYVLPKVKTKDNSLIRDSDHLKEWRLFARKRFIELLEEEGVIVSVDKRVHVTYKDQDGSISIDEEVEQYAMVD